MLGARIARRDPTGQRGLYQAALVRLASRQTPETRHEFAG